MILASCNKEKQEAVLPLQDESFYKAELQQLLNLKAPVSVATGKQKNIPSIHFTFKTYKEAYMFFKAYKEMPAVMHTDTLRMTTELFRISPSTTPLIYATTYGTHYVNYAGNVNSTTTITQMIAPGTVGAQYVVNCTVGYGYTEAAPGGPRTYISRQITGTTATTPNLTYAGLGHLEGTPIVSLLTGIGQGQYTSNMQGVVTIAGTETSFIIQVNGAFNITIPWTEGPAGSVTINHSIQATGY
jgi:hypothetical protein